MNETKRGRPRTITMKFQIQSDPKVRKRKNSATVLVKDASEKADTQPAEAVQIDEESQMGRFKWYTFENTFHIPYILRKGEGYCAARMVEKVISGYLAYISRNVYYECTKIPSYYITPAESKLLNEINCVHCDCEFGRATFFLQEVVVRLDDVINFHAFLRTCFDKIFRPQPSTICGFIRINGDSNVPYVTYAKSKYLPLFYFEEVDFSKLKVVVLRGWYLSYLKFCYKVQGLRDCFFKDNECYAAKFEDIKRLFESGTTFEEFWPANLRESRLLVNNPVGTYKQSPSTAWFCRPLNGCV